MKNLARTLGVAALVWSASALADTATYQPWAPPDDTVKTFAAELKALVDAATKAKAADPKFLDDLRDLVAKYEVASAAPVLDDGFADGDYLYDPSWTVASGRFSVDPEYGLRSSIPLPAATSSSGGSQDLGLLILQTVLTTVAQQQAGTAATISTPVAIADAFDATVEFSSIVAGGRVAFGPYARTDVGSGYRLVYASGKTPALQLVAISGGRQTVVATKDLKAALEDRKRHTLTWTRNLYGEMVIGLDGVEIMRATDRTFRDGFTGFTFSNLGGDFVVRRVQVRS